MSGRTNLSRYDNSWYKPGRGFFVRGIWYLVSAVYFQSRFPFSGIKIFLLRRFGARIGKGVVIKPSVSIKYPWNLEIGDHVWIGEKAWIDNLAHVKIGSHSCISQGAMLLTGNHNYKKETFDLMVAPITLEEGVWIGAKALVAPGVTCGTHSVLSVLSAATQNLEPYSLYTGNPAQKIRERTISQL